MWSRSFGGFRFVQCKQRGRHFVRKTIIQPATYQRQTVVKHKLISLTRCFTRNHLMEAIDILGIIAGICTSSSIIPQIWTTLRKKRAKDVSVFMFIVLMTGNSLWVYYGFEKSDIAIIATNFLALGLNIVMLSLKYLYRNNR